MASEEKAPMTTWLGIAIVALLLIGICVFGYRKFNEGSPRDPSTYPKEAFQAPGYANTQRPGPGQPAQGQPAPGQPTQP